MARGSAWGGMVTSQTDIYIPALLSLKTKWYHCYHGNHGVLNLKLKKNYSLALIIETLYLTIFIIAPMTVKFGTSIKLDVFYTMGTKRFVTTIRNYDVITCLLVNA